MDDSIILNLLMYIDQKNKQSLQTTPFEWIGIFSLFFKVTGDWYFRVSCSLLWGIIMVFVMVQHVRYFL
jgi:hypothetical protein